MSSQLLDSSFLLQHVSADFLRAMQAEGFTHAACGSSQQYQNRIRLAAIIAFYKPEGAPQLNDFVQVPTWQVAKERALGESETDYAPPSEIRYSEAALADYLYARRMALGSRFSFAGILGAMEKEALEEALLPTS